MKTISLDLVGLNGNAFALLGAFNKQARREGWTKQEINTVNQEATNGDYTKLVNTLQKYCKSVSDTSTS